MLRRLLLLTGLAAFVAYLLRRRPASSAPKTDTDPAEELRRKLDEARSREDTAPEAEPALSDDLDARRREVHERARASADDMRSSTD